MRHVDTRDAGPYFSRNQTRTCTVAPGVHIDPKAPLHIIGWAKCPIAGLGGGNGNLARVAAQRDGISQNACRPSGNVKRHRQPARRTGADSKRAIRHEFIGDDGESDALPISGACRENILFVNIKSAGRIGHGQDNLVPITGGVTFHRGQKSGSGGGGVSL